MWVSQLLVSTHDTCITTSCCEGHSRHTPDHLMTRVTSGRDQNALSVAKPARGCARRLCSVCAWWRRPRAQTCCTQRGAATPAKLTTGLTIRTARQHACHKRRSTALTRLLTTTTQLLVSCGRELADFPARPCQPPLPSPARRASAHRLLAHWLVHTRARQTPGAAASPACPPTAAGAPAPAPARATSPPIRLPGLAQATVQQPTAAQLTEPHAPFLRGSFLERFHQ